jgi:hypothetical protein
MNAGNRRFTTISGIFNENLAIYTLFERFRMKSRNMCLKMHSEILFNKYFLKSTQITHIYVEFYIFRNVFLNTFSVKISLYSFF